MAALTMKPRLPDPLVPPVTASRRWLLISAAACLAFTVADMTHAAPAPSPNSLVLAVANEYRAGGGFNWCEGSGTPEEIRFKGSRILSKGKGGTYCCGFTFAVVMKAAARAGLLQDKSIEQIRQFQREWYGAAPASADRQCALALENLKIGREVKLAEARPGDFVRLWQTTCGHSVIFQRWIVEKGRCVGMEYRGTQGSTDGIGNATEYFKAVPGHDGTIDVEGTHVARLLDKAATPERLGHGTVAPGTKAPVKMNP